ncbi:nucleotidyltransferase domain-containing protein [Candidatus Woesearchaeota archaeon]|nr:nucleotidyltransferase domain-containing protein [Candidatus Woesearchaeota archaeon]
MNYKLIAYATDFASFLIQNIDECYKIRQIILFGSVARGDADIKSDVDLFIDVTDEKLEAKIAKIKEKFYGSVKAKKYWQLLGIKNEIHCTVGKLNEWDELKRSIVANGIQLFGKYKGELKTDASYLFTVMPGKNRNKNISAWRMLYGYKQIINSKTYLKKGLLNEYNGRKIANGVFIVPAEHTQNMSSFLRKNGFKYTLIPFWQETK